MSICFCTSNNTGFLIACNKNNIEIVKLLIEKYPDIIE